MTPALPDSSTHPAWPAPRLDPAVAGTAFGLLSALAYVASNICLRTVTDFDPAWVSCIKATTTAVLVSPWLVVRAAGGHRIVPRVGFLAALLAAALFCQLAGNVAFQWALGVVGIAMTVPLALGTLIVAGGIMGRMFLGEPITPRTAIAMLLLISSMCVLGLAARQAHQSVSGPVGGDAAAPGSLLLAAGVGCACLAGFSFSVMNVVMRFGLTRGAPLSSAVFIVALTGTGLLGGLSYFRIGLAGMWQTGAESLAVMLLAGVFNAVAFVSLSAALRLTNIAHVNALNASQTAMAVLAGVFLFGETLSATLVLGVLLTIVGLSLIKGRQRKVAPAAAAVQQRSAIGSEREGDGLNVATGPDARRPVTKTE